MALSEKAMSKIASVRGMRLLGTGDNHTMLPMHPEEMPDPLVLSTVMCIQVEQLDHAKPSVSISGLRPILIRELLIAEQQAQGRVLHAKLSTDAIKVLAGTVMTTIQDASGSRVLLCIKNKVLWEATPAQINSSFPQGARVAVKEPKLWKSMVIYPVIAVDNPASVEVISYFSEQESASFQSENCEQLRIKGNRYGSYHRAAELYELSAARCPADNTKERVLAHSNLAACMLKLGRFEAAVDEADAALILDPRHGKSSYRKGMALRQLHLYDWACQVLAAALHDSVEAGETAEDLLSAYTRCKTLSEQSKDDGCRTSLEQAWKCIRVLVQQDSSFGYRGGRVGIGHSRGSIEDHEEMMRQTMAAAHDASAKLAASSIPLVPEFAEYVGPVEIKMCLDQSEDRGRGLFATRNIKRGELLLVSNALAFSQADQGDRSIGNRDVAVQLLEKGMNSPRARAQIYSMVDKGVPLQTREVPETRHYKPNWCSAEDWTSTGTKPSSEGFDLKRTFEIASAASFNPSGCGVYQNLYTAVWGLPSYINHSCVANVGCLVVGETAFYVAVRDIQAEEELVHSYIMPSHPYRRSRLQYKCNCRKCELERKFDEQLKEVASCYRDPIEAKAIAFRGDADLLKAVHRLESLLTCELEDEEDREMLRSVFQALYLWYYECGSKQQKKRCGTEFPGIKIPPAEAIMRAMHNCCSGYLSTMTFMRGLMQHAEDKVMARKLIKEEGEALLRLPIQLCVEVEPLIKTELAELEA